MIDLKTRALTRAQIGDFAKTPRAVRAFEAAQEDLATHNTALTTATFLTVSSEPQLGAERILTPIAGELAGTDEGASAPYTLGLADTAVTPDTYGDATHLIGLTIDQKGRITDAEPFLLEASNVAATGILSTAQDYFDALSNAPNTSKFIVSDGAIIHRLGDRLLVGGAVENDGAYPNVVKDWLTTFETTTGGRSNGTMVTAQVGILNNNHFNAAQVLLTGGRTLNFISAATGLSGHSSVVVNNNATYETYAWGAYFEAHQENTTVGGTYSLECDVRNGSGVYRAVTPTNQHAKQTVAIQIAAGAEYPAPGQEDASAGINFRNNPTKFGVGIVFGYNAIRGTDGSTGYGNAILSGLRHKFAWMNSSDQITGAIWGEATSTANKTSIALASVGAAILGPSDTIVALFRPVTSAVNYLDVTAGGTGVPVTIAASGSDTDIDFLLKGQGAGLLAFGTWASAAGPAVNGYITIKDAGGTTRKLATIA